MNVRSIAFVVGLGLVACSGKKEADQMTKFADEICKCKTTDCADKLFPEIEKFTKENEGKEVDKGAADRYNAAMARAQKCMDDLAKAPAATPPAEQPKTDEQK
jgi:hypothetical protein